MVMHLVGAAETEAPAAAEVGTSRWLDEREMSAGDDLFHNGRAQS